ncbi:MAG: CBS domain-containing protein [Candidatus Heimdallarchaeota archaeon]|nr:CBS domain-containing protein [Candidatus Heimdallarchaeota archaeon]
MPKKISLSQIMTKKEDLTTMRIPGNREILLDAIRKTNLSVYPVLKKETDELVGIVSRSDLFKKPDETQLSLLMIRDFITLNSNNDVIDAARIFADSLFQRIPIVDVKDEKKLLGLVARSDIVKKVILQAKNDMEITRFYNPNVTVIWEETPINIAANILRLSHQKGIPVINESGMVGIITQNDFLKVAEIFDSKSTSRTGHGAENDSSSWDSESILIIGSKTLTLPKNMKISDIMERNIEVCYSSSTIHEVTKKIVQKRIDQLPVVSVSGKILGMINQQHLIQAYVDFYDSGKN